MPAIYIALFVGFVFCVGFYFGAAFALATKKEIDRPNETIKEFQARLIENAKKNAHEILFPSGTGKTKPTAEERGKWVCGKCTTYFMTEKQFYNHMKRHS